MKCEERDTLMKVYSTAMARIPIAGQAIVDMQSQEWRSATADARSECEGALDALNWYRREHGC